MIGSANKIKDTFGTSVKETTVLVQVLSCHQVSIQSFLELGVEIFLVQLRKL